MPNLSPTDYDGSWDKGAQLGPAAFGCKELLRTLETAKINVGRRVHQLPVEDLKC